jgi:hypothetical protein
MAKTTREMTTRAMTEKTVEPTGEALFAMSSMLAISRATPFEP